MLVKPDTLYLRGGSSQHFKLRTNLKLKVCHRKQYVFSFVPGAGPNG